MKQVFLNRCLTRWGAIATSLSSGLVFAVPAIAQQIIPDDTLPTPSSVESGCVVCTINGGTSVGNNLFHSFTEFSVPTGGEALFNNLNTVETIFSRVTGTLVSDIDGLIQTNGNADLFLLNPNGILFGPNAHLNIGGSFTASTANSLVFPDGSEFSAITPEVPPLLTVSLDGGWLSASHQTFAAGSTLTNRSSLAVGQDLILMADQLDLQGQLYAGSDLQLVATDTVRIRDSLATPTVVAANGQLQIQGNQAIDIFALNHPSSGLFSGAAMHLQSANPVVGDARYWSGESFRITTLDEALGELASPNDPVIRALGDVTFDAYQGSSLHILAGGSVAIGTLVITQPETAAPADGFLQETIQLSNGTPLAIDGSAQPTLDIRAGVNTEAIGIPAIMGVDPLLDLVLGIPDLTAPATGADITVGDVFVAAPDGLVLLTNQYQPNQDLAGGDITVTGAGLFEVGISTVSDIGSGGDVTLDARGDILLASGVDTRTDFTDAGNVTLLATGDIFLTEGAFIVTDGFWGGNILLQSGGAIAVTDSLISSDSTSVFGTPGDITFSASDDISLTAGSGIFASGSSGSTVLFESEGAIALSDSVLFSDSFALTPSTDQGDITFRAESVLFSGEDASIEAFTFGAGAGSPIIIQANDTVSFDGGVIFTSSEPGTTGSVGDIEITTGRLLITGGGGLTSIAEGTENAGNITVTATDSVILDGVSQDGIEQSGIASSTLQGVQADSGTISITTPELDVTNGAFLGSISFGIGDAGDVVINAGDVLVDGVNTQGGILNRSLFTAVALNGDGGDIRITGDTFTLGGGAQIAASPLVDSSTGSVILNITDTVAIDGESPLGLDGIPLAPSTIFVTTVPDLFEGDAGDIVITTDNLALTNGARLLASTATAGQGGSITINSQTASIDGGSLVSAVSNGTGNAGNITVSADVLSLDNESFIVTETTSSQGGDITLTLQDILLLRNSSLISTTAGLAQDDGDGGNITIDVRSGSVVAVPEENSDITANAFTGQGGNVAITAQGILGIERRNQLTPLSDITATSQLGIDGTLQIETLALPPDQGAIALPSDFVDSSQLLAQGCESFNAEADSQGEFFVSGRGGIGPLASETLGSEDVLEDLRLPEAWADDSSITEAQNWFVAATGKVVLTAEPLPEATHHRCWRQGQREEL